MPKIETTSPSLFEYSYPPLLLNSNMQPTYAEICAAIVAVATAISVGSSMAGDGRIQSATKEGPFLEAFKRELLRAHPTFQVEISPPRAACDLLVNGLRINLKLTDCKSADNSCNKPSLFFSITGDTNYPYSSTWNDFWQKLQEAKTAGKVKLRRDPMTEYHYLVKNKQTDEVLFKSIFDIHTYRSNPSNDLQIHWGNEFAHKEYMTTEADYMNKVRELLTTIQRSVQQNIASTKNLADADITSF